MKEEYINTTKEEIESKKFNIFIGISLDNLFFSKTNLKEYILWALKYTKEDVIVMIADDIQAVNYQVFKGLSKDKALLKARKQGNEKEVAIGRIVSDLSEEEKERVKVIKWKDVASERYSKKVDLIFKEFEKNEEFRKFVVEIVSDALGKKAKNVSDKDMLKLSEYVLNELPLIIEGLDYDGKYYAVMPYPNRNSLDNFILGIHEGKVFPEFFSKIVESKKLEVVLK